jgi:hypothetical protein
MSDLTIIYPTANILPDKTTNKFRKELLSVVKGKYPIISVSFKPIDFGLNICVGNIGRSNYNYFKQLLIATKHIKTEYFAVCDDDTLYNEEHFSQRPKVFAYNTNVWFGGGKVFWRQKDMSGMSAHLGKTKCLIDNLEPRFKMYPIAPYDVRHFGEPGKFDTDFGIPNARVDTFSTKIPIITFEYRGSLNGKRKRFGLPDPKNWIDDLEPYGNAKKLQNYFFE